MIATIALSYWVVSKEAAATGYGYYNLVHAHHSDEAAATLSASSATGGGMWTVSFAYYALFIHIIVFLFPVRACWSMFTITRALKKNQKSKALRDIKLSHRRRGSSTSLSSSETLTSSRDGSALSSATSSEAGDLEPEQYTDSDATSIDNIVHAVVIPNYKEEVDTLRETLDVLASHPQARHSYDVSVLLFSRAMIGGEHSTRVTLKMVYNCITGQSLLSFRACARETNCDSVCL